MLKRVIDIISDYMAVASSLSVIAIMVAIVIDVIGRAMFSAPLAGASEFAVTALVVVVFFGLAAAQKQGGNFRVDMLINALPSSGQHVLEILWRIIVLAVLVTVSWLTTREAIGSAQSLEASYGVIAFPIWPARIVLAAGFWILTFQIAIEIFKFALSGPQPVPAQSEHGPTESI